MLWLVIAGGQVGWLTVGNETPASLDDGRSTDTDTDTDMLARQQPEDQPRLHGPNFGSTLWDYGNKAWGGLVDPYYSRRYQIYAAHKLQSIEDKKPFDESAYDAALVAWAHSFEHRRWDEAELPATPTGDAVALSRALWRKYAPAA